MNAVNTEIGQGRGDNAPPVTIREILRLLWEADRYPCLGNGDNRAADRLERDALDMAVRATPCADDPPEFAIWLNALCGQALSHDARDTIMEKLYDLFDPEDENAPWA